MASRWPRSPETAPLARLTLRRVVGSSAPNRVVGLVTNLFATTVMTRIQSSGEVRALATHNRPLALPKPTADRIR